MLRSFCIKTNNQKIIDYMLYGFENANLANLYISNRKFKNYKNIILHFNGNDKASFYALIAGAITDVILNFYENTLIRYSLISNYFYFNLMDIKEILGYCNETINESLKEKIYRSNMIFSLCFDYIKENKYLNLDGFIRFRLKDYLKEIDEIVDISVDRFVLDREYHEFTSLLKLYVQTKEPLNNVIHLIYQSGESTLLDNEKNVIDISSDIFDVRYLSDISFSPNDYALNALLNLLPQKIIVHLIDNNKDEFINTLELIFGEQINMCKNCTICNIYRRKCNETAKKIIFTLAKKYDKIHVLKL